MSNPEGTVQVVPDAPDLETHTHLFMTTDIDTADIQSRVEAIRGEHPYRRPCQLCWTPVDLMPAARSRRT